MLRSLSARGSKSGVTLAPVKENRPSSSDFAQQRTETIMPRLTEKRAMILLFMIGIIFCPIGQYIRYLNEDVFEQTKVYDGDDADVQGCSISESNQGEVCTVTFQLDKDVTGPLYVYYQLRNVYQNHRRYVNSKSIQQNLGNNLKKSDVELECSPLVTLNYENDDDTNGPVGEQLLNPCGLIANSMFNDIIKFDSASSTKGGISMDETGIVLPTDKDKYKQVEGFTKRKVVVGTECKDSSDPTPTCAPGEKCYEQSGDLYCYSYPDEDTVQYLYETFPDNISPLDGVTDEHFIVWMRTAGLPSFRNLYGKFDSDFNRGDVISFEVTANFEVNSFKGSKAIILTTVGAYGGANPFLGSCFIVIGSISFFLMAVIAAKYLIRRYNQR